MKRAILVATILAAAGSARAADNAAAHAHARKANSLAASGKCRQAVPEYDAAYRLLKDPALLFNRAECQRKLGRGPQAVHDYKRFLEEMPSAPNRHLVESRILALDPSSGIQTKTLVQVPPAAETPAPTPTAPQKEPEPAPALRPAALRTPLPAAAPEPAPAAPIAAAPVLVERPQAQPASSSEGRAWLWLSMAAAVVAVSAGGALYLTGKPRNQ